MAPPWEEGMVAWAPEQHQACHPGNPRRGTPLTIRSAEGFPGGRVQARRDGGRHRGRQNCRIMDICDDVPPRATAVGSGTGRGGPSPPTTPYPPQGPPPPLSPPP